MAIKGFSQLAEMVQKSVADFIDHGIEIIKSNVSLAPQ